MADFSYKGKGSTYGANLEIKTFNELNLVIDSKTRIALRNTYERLLNELMDIIDEKVYGRHDPKFYDRSYSLKQRENWDTGKISKYNNEIKIKFSFLGDTYEYEDEFFRHSNIYGHRINPTTLLNIIDKGWSSSKYSEPPFNFPKLEGTEFWEEFKKYVDEHWENMFKEEFNKL